MSSVARPHQSVTSIASQQPLALRIAAALEGMPDTALSSAVIAKAKVCLFDFIGCAFESQDLPWSVQAVGLAERSARGAAIIGKSYLTAPGDAAFANAVMGHGLVREDMHPGSISHLGVAVLPTLLALAQQHHCSGQELISAILAGYEVGGGVGRAAMDAEVARIHRPTGIAGPIGAVAAAAKLLRLNIQQTTSAIALGANCTAGFNQWAHTGGSEMFFHPGFAARNAISAVRLAQAGAFASPSALDGEAGLFAALRKQTSAATVRLFQAEPEILSVYHKPVPACNFAQTPTQAALVLCREHAIAPEDIASIDVNVPRAGALYPGCDSVGPFDHVLQAKMSIQYNVAAALVHGSASENNFAKLDDPRVARLVALTRLRVDDDLTRAYPSEQGGEVRLRKADGKTLELRLRDVVNASAADVRARFMTAATAVMGDSRAQAIEAAIDTIEHLSDCAQLGLLLQASTQ